jgi:hypothetical protein
MKEDMLFECVLLTSPVKAPTRQIYTKLGDSGISVISRNQNHREKEKTRCLHESARGPAGRLYSQPPKWPRPPAEKILRVCTGVTAGLDARATMVVMVLDEEEVRALDTSAGA